MDDFSSPGMSNSFGLRPAKANFIAPYKRPLSSMCPYIVLDENNNAILVAGSAGGSKITTTLAYVSFSAFFMKKIFPNKIFMFSYNDVI